MFVAHEPKVTLLDQSKTYSCCRRRAVEKSEAEDDEIDDVDDDQFDEEEGDNEVEGKAASSGIGEASSMMDTISSKEKDAQQEAQRQRNLEQALLIQMELQKTRHEQLEVITLFILQTMLKLIGAYANIAQVVHELWWQYCRLCSLSSCIAGLATACL